MPARFEAGTLRRAVADTTRSAAACGALHPIDSAIEHLVQDGVPFVVRVATNLRRKRAERARLEQDERGSGRPCNPFLPPEPELTVGAISDTHIGVLNKFNVVPDHLLLVTREFEHQERLLTPSDFEALFLCLAEYPSLGFYNGGRIAGASQPHKHLQVVPTPICEDERPFPFEPLFSSAPAGEAIRRLEALPFIHGFCRLPATLRDDLIPLVRHAWIRYRELLARCGVGVAGGSDDERQRGPYNLLATREWLLLVPRSREYSRGISINGLGYAGSLFVLDRAGLETVRQAGPMNILREVSVAG